jgi:hypothetical protein
MGITEQEIHLLAEVERSVEDCYHHFTDLAHGFEHRSMFDRFFTKLLKLQEAMKTPSGRAMAAHRIAFLHLYLQELQHELTIGGSGYDMRTEVVHSLLRRKYGGEEQKEEQQIEDLQRGRVIDMSRLSRKQHEV